MMLLPITLMPQIVSRRLNLTVCQLFGLFHNMPSYQNSLFTEAVACLLKAIEIFTDMGRFTIAAKHHQTIAEIYEADLVSLDRAVQHYEQAADYFKGITTVIKYSLNSPLRLLPWLP